MEFTHLHVHTEYSLLDGSNKIKEYVARVKELGMDSAAITDHGVMYGVIDFYRAAREAGINPILGCEVYVAPGSRFDREVGSGDDRYYHLVLLAENNQGYSNLMKIVSKAFVEGFYYKPRVDLELLEKYHEGIIALSACLAGEVARYLARGMYEDAKIVALRYQDIFGKGNFFLELQDHGIPEQQTVNQQLLRMHRETGIDLVATNDVHYTMAEDAEPHDVLLCLQTQKKLSDENRMRYEGGQYYVKSPEEMARLFPYALEALENTHKIAERCHVEIEFGVTKLPKYDVPDGLTSWEYLNKLCYEGLEQRYHPVTEELKKRLDYELSTIKNMGYVDYFLIVWDFIKYARDNDIMVGPGRGSAAGSLVAYTLGITQLDPIRYDLLFERFLNPERVSMPDIDVDFCFERRQEVIDYVRRKYGDDCVVQIVTFGTLAARGVIRDVGRVLDMPYAQVDTIAKMIPQELNITIDKALGMNPELRKAYEEQDDIHRLIDLAKRLEGLPRHTSMHAAGVVISQKDVSEYVPLSRAQDGSIVTQFTMTTLEELGLLKMDFLGLRTLTVIQNAVKMVEKSTGMLLDMQEIDYNDKKVLDSLGTGRTDGVFQLESAGMKSFMKELKPQSLEDVIAGISLYRPGPMDFIPQYIRGKNRPDTIRYDCPQMEPILKPTYGCIVYQEQVMQIVRELAGYTLGRSDLVRRAMSKKKASVMAKERQNFVYGNAEEGVPGCIANGISEEIANKIYDEMTDFAKYAFNKSHAAAYAVVSYQTAYLKYYYPVEFMAALMTSVVEMPNKVAEYISVCRQMGIRILPPDINHGVYGFSVDNGAIRYALSAIKSIGRPVIEGIVREREEHGEYTSLKTFIERNIDQINKRVVENLIKAGALDCLEGNRNQKMTVYTQIIDSINQDKKHTMAGQLSLFDIAPEEDKNEFEIRMPQAAEYPKETILTFEKEVLGIYLSGHPLERYRNMMEKMISAKTSDFQPDDETGIPEVYDNQKVIVGGMITDKTIKYTKNNKVMAFLTVEDLVGTVEVVVFPRDYEKCQMFLNEDARLFIQGRVSAEDDKASKLILEKVRLFDDMPRELWLQFESREEYAKAETGLVDDLMESRGNSTVVIYLKDVKAMKKLPPAYQVHIEDSWLERMCEKYGSSNVKIVERVLKNL
ncbi:DNA polymerase III subunit alpha [Blautia massiliensis]|uniref:DNA polymerase III subunit alpha n=1 Tax=Blautia TaxID=572511 RepID=UPI000E4D3DA9|nr:MULTISPECIES: DNA polymerase III subunit alpha [Blautia]RHP72020.1 DNA polymerase III subunit alpha [Ruminococcus sp. OF02-6]MBN2957317.1 DNA polymerase III subunit alpha [Blautia massiliensis (ex Durand et al. 2017)]MCC2727214.1 DNA polymerase III subunit alpha [Blautia sp. MSK22_86]NSF58307.1 DNA polymerase III subunit alpha [Blautia massiliensis (ex Durand et al. 2017)]NSK73685.1 DNA polymerase III subunit alpha [Blautia massiliensis (ex Durand et al. 2017)]